MFVIFVISQHAIKMTVIMFKILDMIKHLSLNGSLIFTSLFLCICLLVSVWQWQAVDLIFTNLLPLLAHPASIRCPLHHPLTPSALMCNWQQQLAPGGNQRQLPSWSRSSSGRHISKLEIPEKQGDSKSRTLIVYGLSRPDGRVLRTVNWTPSGKWRGNSVWKAEIHCKSMMKVEFGDNYECGKWSCVAVAEKLFNCILFFLIFYFEKNPVIDFWLMIIIN